MRSVRWLSAGLVAGWLLCLTGVVIWSQRDSQGPVPADAIIVLGAAQYDGRPSPVLRARLDHAITLFQNRRAPRLVLTGGHQDGEHTSEAEAGQRYAIRRGVPSVAILVETLGRTSQESIRSAAALLRQDRSRDGHDAHPRVLLVSDPFHMLRLDVLARLNGLTPLPSPTRTSPISAKPWMALEYVLRESVALPTDVLQELLP
jgi:uncharacterized SAM-binding protein YcdF (DUF218 family)